MSKKRKDTQDRREHMQDDLETLEGGCSEDNIVEY